MKYEKELKEFLKDLFYESWMNDADYEEFITEVFKIRNTSYEKMNKEIEVGVQNGYSVEQQFAIVRIFLKSLKK